MLCGFSFLPVFLLANWKLKSPAAAQQMIVYFEWLHVKVGSEKARHIVGVSVCDVLCGCTLCRCPLLLRNTCLHFSFAWLKAVADAKKRGMTYCGVGREVHGDTEIVPNIPNHGLDIHDVPLHWDRPCGRSICCSV